MFSFKSDIQEGVFSTSFSSKDDSPLTQNGSTDTCEQCVVSVVSNISSFLYKVQNIYKKIKYIYYKYTFIRKV
jgi:hypothetical protein